MNKQTNSPSIVIDGQPITPQIIESLEDLKRFGIGIKDFLAKQTFAIAANDPYKAGVESEFFELQSSFYSLLEALFISQEES